MRTAALVFLGVASVLMCGLLWFHTVWAAMVFVLLALGFPVALMVLGAHRRHRLGPVVSLGLLIVVLEVAWVVLFLLRGQALEVAGIPLALAVQVSALLGVPLVLVSLGFAHDFARFSVDEQELEELKRSAAVESDS